MHWIVRRHCLFKALNSVSDHTHVDENGKKVIAIPELINDAVKACEEQKTRIMNVGGKMVIGPARDVVQLALYERKIGRILPEEIEEESMHEQEKLSGFETGRHH